MRRLILFASFFVAMPLFAQTPTFQGGRALTLTAADGNREEWIRVTRTCPGPAANCDNGRGGFSSKVERSPDLETLGSSSGTVYVPHSATLTFTASLTDGTVPAGHYLKIYWQGYPKDEDSACRANSGSMCSVTRQLAPAGNPYHPTVCAAFVYEKAAANLGDGYQAVCINAAYSN